LIRNARHAGAQMVRLSGAISARCDRGKSRSRYRGFASSPIETKRCGEMVSEDIIVRNDAMSFFQPDAPGGTRPSSYRRAVFASLCARGIMARRQPPDQQWRTGPHDFWASGEARGRPSIFAGTGSGTLRATNPQHSVESVDSNAIPC
jgi:hypothetical protein